MGIRSSAELEPPVAWSSTVGSVLCVACSSEGVVHARNEAIRIAKDRGEPLVFLWVADSSFLNNLAAPALSISYKYWRACRFLLCSAVRRASEEGVEAGRLVRRGVVREVFPALVAEIDAAMTIIGPVIDDPSYS